MTITKTELKDIKSLRAGKGRKEKKLFMVEGVRALEEARRHHRSPLTVLFAPSLVSERAEKLAAAFLRAGAHVEQVSAREIGGVSDARTSQGLLGVFAIPDTTPEQLLAPRLRRILMCDGVSDPGNLGAILRSAAGFGFSAVALAGDCADPWSPKVVRSSVGAIFALKAARVEADAWLAAVASGDRLVLAADLGGDNDVASATNDLADRRVILAVGSEAHGLSTEVLRAADRRLRLNHEPAVESLNVAVAASIIMRQLYELDRR